MPELPEVETTVRYLKDKIIGQKIIGLDFDTPNLIKKPSPEELKRQIVGKKITKIERRGKNILIYLNQDYLLLIHQKLTGHLLYGKWQKEKGKWLPQEKNSPLFLDRQNRFIHFLLFLANGKMLALSDLRKFAKIIFAKKEEILNSDDLKTLGPEPLSKEFTLTYFQKICQKSNKPIKTLLMDQNLISGIGNVYSDEILWQAKISPLRKANSLKEKEIKVIYQKIKAVLKEAIKLQGTSIVDYRKPDGAKGKMDKFLKVYRKEGQKCPRCQGIIKRVVINGRSAHFCPKCQK